MAPPTHMMLTVLVVGAGRFGRNYLKVLAGWHATASPDAPRIQTLLLSRTRLTAARALAAEIAAQPDCPFAQVLGVAVADGAQLEAVLHHHQPDLTCIVARDSHVGDDIHALYALPALDVGAVLCEKPFCHARGDGASLERARALLDHPHADRFGLELPLAVMGRALLADEGLGLMLRNAQRIRIVWQKPANSTDLVDDLALHPWSLIPSDWQMEIEQMERTEKRVDIALQLHPDPASSRSVSAHIRLAAGGVFRGICIDTRSFDFAFHKGRLQLWEYDAPWEALIAGKAHSAKRRLALSVGNPLAQHIRASLAYRPLVDAQRTFASQKFLEAVKGKGAFRQ